MTNMRKETRKHDVPLEIVDHNAQSARRAPPPVPMASVEDQEQTIHDYLEIILESRWIILGLLAAGLILGGMYYLFATPVYRSDVLVQVEDKKVSMSGMDDLNSMFGNATLAETEIEIIRSRALLGAVVDDLKLDLIVEPHFFPLFGRGLARQRAADAPSNSVLGLSSYAWGGERIQVDRLDVPKSWEGERLSLIAREGRHYDVLDPSGRFLGQGEVGKALTAGRIGLFVSELMARQGTTFRLVKRPRSSAIEDLLRELVALERGKKTGIIRISLEDTSPDRVAAILDAIARTYLRQNVERKSAEAEKTLNFITAQLPQLKANVDVSETALKEYRASRGGGLDLSVEAKAALDRASDIEKSLTEIELQRSELRQRFTDSHPALQALNQKAIRLQHERENLNVQMRRLPETELNAASLVRDAKVANELYVLLLNKAQELQVMKSGTIGNVRILDTAVVPREPLRPTFGVTMLLSVLLGLALGMGLAFARKALNQGIEDPEVIERETGLPVYAAVPHSVAQQEYATSSKKKGSGGGIPVLAVSQPADLAVEAVRSLRTSLQFALAEASNNVVAIGGPSPGIGKSFVSVNLAHVMADAGKRVLLVDADMRKGRLHYYFDNTKSPGLSEIIRATVTAKDATRKAAIENLHFIPMGEAPTNPSELLSSRRFEEFVELSSKEYDIVIIDTAPILAVTDAAIAGRTAGTNLLVLRAGQHPLREIALAVKRMTQNGIVPRAFVLNDIAPKIGRYSSSKYGYHYHYDYK